MNLSQVCYGLALDLAWTLVPRALGALLSPWLPLGRPRVEREPVDAVSPMTPLALFPHPPGPAVPEHTPGGGGVRHPAQPGQQGARLGGRRDPGAAVPRSCSGPEPSPRERGLAVANHREAKTSYFPRENRWAWGPRGWGRWQNRTDPEAKRSELPFFVLSPVCGSVTVSSGAWSLSGPPSLPSLSPG